MSSFGQSKREVCLLALVTGLQLFSSSPRTGECLSLEIKGQSAITVQEGENSEIVFFIYNMSHEETKTLYVSKGELHLCKLLVTQTTCSRFMFSGSCQCSTRSREGRLEFVLMRQFQAEDGGEWKFEVWDTGITQTVNISVKAKEGTTNTPLRGNAPLTKKPTPLKEKSTKAKAVTSVTSALQTPKSTQTSTTTSTFTASDHLLSNKSEVLGAAHEPQRAGLESYVVVIIVLLIIVTVVGLTVSFIGWRHPGYIRRLRSYLVTLRPAHTCWAWIDGFRNRLTVDFEPNTYDRPINRASEGFRYAAFARFFRRSRPASRNDIYESVICTDDDGYLLTSFDGKDKARSGQPSDAVPPLDDYPRSSNIYEIPLPSKHVGHETTKMTADLIPPTDEQENLKGDSPTASRT